MSKQNKRNIQAIIGKIKKEKEVEWKGYLLYFAIGGLHMEELFDSSFVYYHLCYILVLVFNGQI